MGVAQGGEGLPQQAQHAVERQRAIAVHQLRHVRPIDDLHRVPEQARPPGDVVDVHDVDVVESSGELRFASEPFNGRQVLGQVRMQHLERDLSLEVQVAHAVHPTEAALPELPEELVVVAQCAAHPRFPVRPVGELDGEGRQGHVDRLVLARLGSEVLEHLRRREVALVGTRIERAEDHALKRGRNDATDLSWRHELLCVERRRRRGHGEIQHRAGRVHVAGRIAGLPVAHFRRQEGRAGRLLRRRNVRQREVAVPQVGDGAATGRGEQQRRRDDAADDDAMRMRVFERPEDVAGQAVDRRDRPRTTLDRIGERLAVDPVADAVGNVADDAGLVDMADRRMVEARQRLGLAEEPPPQRVTGVEVDTQRDGAVQPPIMGAKEQPLRRDGHRGVQAETLAEGGGDTGELKLWDVSRHA